MFTPADHNKLLLAMDLLHWASEIVNDVLENHRLDMTMQLASFLNEAKREADVGVTTIANGKVEEANPHVENAEREIGMADRYMNWQESSKRELCTLDECEAAPRCSSGATVWHDKTANCGTQGDAP